MNTEDVLKVARLARLHLEKDEIESLGKHLTNILEYVALLDEVDTEGVEPMAHAIEQHNVFREDENRPSLSRDQALANAPQHDGSFYRVPPILAGRD